MEVPDPPWQHVRLFIAGSFRHALPDGYLLEPPLRVAGSAISRYFGTDVHLEDEIDSLIAWVERVDDPEMFGGELQVWARVTEEDPGFGLNIAGRILGRIAALGMSFDVSVYVA